MKRFICVLFIMLLLTGCSNSSNNISDKKNVDKGNQYEKINIKLENAKENSSYLIFFMKPGDRNETKGAANQSGYYGPFETNEDNELIIDLLYNFDLNYLISKTKDLKLQLYVTTKEDKYIRNPLNDNVYVQFLKNEDENTNVEYEYYSSIKDLNVEINDSYPNGVYSLTFQDATFVIKLNFKDGLTPDSAYLVSIYRPSEVGKNDIGIVRNGRIARNFQYWDTPFYKSDNLSAWNGTIIVEDFETNKRLNYEEFPKRVTFDSNGKCEEGNIINITLTET